MRRAVLWGSLCWVLCTGCSETPPPEAPKPAAKQAKKVERAEIPKGSVGRDNLDAVLRLGIARFFQKVDIREEIVQNKFIGWRLLSMPSEWDGAGLVPGDVVTRINGNVLEHPEEFTKAWNDVSAAKEIRIAYQRDGQPRESVVPIVGGGRSGDRGARVDMDAERPPQKRAESNGIGRSTVIIGGDDDTFDVAD